VTFFFDARFIRVGHHDGISRFAANLCSELSKTRDFKVIVNDVQQLEHLPKGIAHILECAPTSIRELNLARRLNRRGATLVYSPMQTTGSLGKKFKLVLTLHDLIYYRHPKPPSEFNFLVRALWRIYHLSFVPARLMLSRADGLVTISDTSLKLIKDARLFEGEIAVVYNAAEAGRDSAKQAKPSAPSHRLVYMGSFMDYKNVETLIIGSAKLPEFELHLLSRIALERRTQLQQLADAHGASVVFHNGVSDDEYQEILDSAYALVTASKDEGFGIPVIEAMSRATPVVCSDIDIFREIGGLAATFFAAQDSNAFAEAVRSLEANWAKKSELSLENVKRFDWKKSAETLDAYLDKVGSR